MSEWIADMTYTEIMASWLVGIAVICIAVAWAERGRR